MSYMTSASTGWAYNDVKAGTFEEAVDALWFTILQHYFPTSGEPWLVSFQSRPIGISSKRSGVIVRYIQGDNARRVVIVECKREDRGSQTSKWTDAANRLASYLKSARMDGEKGDQRAMYGVVAIDQYVRFYVLPNGQQDLLDFPETNGRIFEVQNDEADVDRLMRDIKQRILQSHSQERC